jgi:hypothetical protein
MLRRPTSGARGHRCLRSVRRASPALGAGALVVVIGLGLSVAAGSAAQAPSAQAAAAVVGGSVFRDHNANGRKDTTTTAPAALDVGLPGVSVTVFGPSGAVVGTASSAPDGKWQVTASAAGPYRVEFSGLPTGYQPASAGSGGAGTAVQFVPASGSATVDLGLNRPDDYCQDNPDLVTNCYQLGGLTVLHLDKSFDLIVEVTGQPIERLVMA